MHAASGSQVRRLCAPFQRLRLRHQQAANGQILIELRPVNADALTDEPPVCELQAGRVAQARKPLERHPDGAPIFKQQGRTKQGFGARAQTPN